MKRSPLLASVAVLTLTGLASAQAPAPAQGPGNLEAGGLKPPEAIDPTQPAPADGTNGTPEKELEEADKEDAGRGLEWVWLNAEIGVQHLGLQTIASSDFLDPSIATTQTGLSFGAGIGVRLLVFTAGVRFRRSVFSEWKLWTLNAEGGFHIPLGSLEPYVTLGAGYVSLGSFPSASGLKDGGVRGANVRLGAGLDWYLSNTFSLGANFTGESLFLSRPAIDGATTEPYTKDGSSVALGGTLTAVVGLHF